MNTLESKRNETYPGSGRTNASATIWKNELTMDFVLPVMKPKSMTNQSSNRPMRIAEKFTWLMKTKRFENPLLLSFPLGSEGREETMLVRSKTMPWSTKMFPWSFDRWGHAYFLKLGTANGRSTPCCGFCFLPRYTSWRSNPKWVNNRWANGRAISAEWIIRTNRGGDP